MNHRPAWAGLAIAVSALSALPAHATDVAIAGDGAWHSFAVDSLLAPVAQSLAWIDDGGQLLDFTFTIGAGMTGLLSVVDAGFAGDVFAVTNFASVLGSTSLVPLGSFEASHDVGTDFGAALSDPTFSRGVFALGAGSYRIGGRLTQSVTFDGESLDATVGAVRLDIAAPVPEPSSYALMLAGLVAAGAIARRRSAFGARA